MQEKWCPNLPLAKTNNSQLIHHKFCLSNYFNFLQAFNLQVAVVLVINAIDCPNYILKFTKYIIAVAMNVFRVVWILKHLCTFDTALKKF